MSMSDEHKAKMAEGRMRALAARRAEMAARRQQAVQMPVDVPPLTKAERAAARPEPPREYAKKRDVAVAPQKPADPLLGINATDCCIDCHMGHCVISGKPYCAHPNKCGLAPVDKMNPQTMERYNRARKVLLHAQVERQS